MNLRIFLLINLLLLVSHNLISQTKLSEDKVDYVALSESLVTQLKKGEPVKMIIRRLKKVDEKELQQFLDTDSKKYAFWLNIYNGFIIHILSIQPELYDDRKSFFKMKQVEIGGRLLSFANIEHGIIRRSQCEYGLGYLRNPFAPKYQRKYRPKEKDYRIHFALNCGARSCPPVDIFNAENVDSKLDELMALYLKKVTSYDEQKNSVTTTPLTSWFRGDFGGKKGTKKILLKEGLIPDTKVDIEYGPYDWTIDLDNFR